MYPWGFGQQHTIIHIIAITYTFQEEVHNILKSISSVSDGDRHEATTPLADRTAELEYPTAAFLTH